MGLQLHLFRSTSAPMFVQLKLQLQPDKVKRHMSVSNGKLSVNFEAVEARFLRASFSAFVDVLTLTTKTIEEFGSKKE
ncbi:uncharacterized protein [Solanum lycopersicum]|uniref:uncharacterized protein isoform X2 n=1 Tax=Solanum lycopersicum TaxID=4081 RepID=UPI000532D6D6|nr:uncharacterized protein LOC101260703 isoform X2 [Solanum lycopersicum]